MDLICLYTNHYLLSFIIILIILYWANIELSGKGFVAAIIAQYVIVQVLWSSHGGKCLNDKREKIDQELRRNF
jgi:uncharacterized membrane protein YiaA